MNTIQYNIHYEWKILHDGVGKTPNVRASSSSWCYNNAVWVLCGSSSGLGKANEVWVFDLRTKLWSKIDTGESGPTGRDGQAGAYIGNGRFVIFGGQGFAEPNQKLGKESDQMKTQTYWKREVYNDLWMFDCNTLKWSPIYPDGLSFPMGRRGASCIYIRHLSQTLYNNTSTLAEPSAARSRRSAGNNTRQTLGEDSSYATPSINSGALRETNTPGRSKNEAPGYGSSNGGSSTVSGPPPLENCLVVYGGAGIELSKYTEQLYSDVWVFSFDRNIWIRYDTKGVDPVPTTDHRVYKLEDSMVVMGGIRDTTPKVGGNAKDTQNTSDIQILNLMTMTWSNLPIYNSSNRDKSLKLNLHGFAAFPDQVFPPSPTVFNPNPHRRGQTPPPLDPGARNSQLILFGGNQVLDTKAAIHSKGMKALKDKSSQDATFFLNIDECSICPILLRGDVFPENRYLHVGVSSTPCNYQINEPPNSQGDNDTVSLASQATLSVAGGPGAAETKKPQESRKSFVPGLGGVDLRTEEAVGYVFGGSNIETGGYCDPILYALMRVKIIDPLMLRGGSAPVTNPTTTSTTAAPTKGSQAQNTAKNVLQFQSSFDNNGSFFEGGGGGSGLMNSRDADIFFAASSSSTNTRGDDMIDPPDFETSSIWVNVQNKANNYRNKQIREPNNWEEVKLSLTFSRSQRSFESLPSAFDNVNVSSPNPQTNSSTRFESFGHGGGGSGSLRPGMSRMASRSGSRQQKQEEAERKRELLRQSKAFPFIQKYQKKSHESFELRSSQSQLLLEYNKKTKPPALIPSHK